MQKFKDYYPGNVKITPDSIAGVIGLPHVGEIFYVDPGAGSDTANAGKSPDDAFATVTQGYAALTADQDDVVIICGSSATGRTAETAAITWAKRRTHVIGNGPLRSINPRNGIAFGASISPGLTVSANNCSFTNISIATFEDNNVLVEVTGEYNTFNYVHFQGIGHATAGDDTAARSLLLTDAEENEFNNCTIGLDTVTRSVANASLELTGSCPRNMFRHCYFPAYTDNAGVLFVKADTGNCTERFLTFEDCIFNNADTGSSTTMTIAMDLSTTGNGTVFLKDSWCKGCTDWTNTFNNLFVTMPLADTDEGGLVKIGT